jgi:hypothetical protein
MPKLILSAFLAMVLAVPISALAADPKQVDWNTEVVDNLDMEYAQDIIGTVCAMGDSPLGFRGTGGPADWQVADYISTEMKKIGLSDVEKEVVPVDAWQFRSAYLDVPGIGKMTAA